MSISSKHNYRFVFLRSEKWKNIRLEALANQNATCKICGYCSIANDAHHIWYPASVWDTDPSDLVILCRPCHELLHVILTIQRNRKQTPTSAMAHIRDLSNALEEWNSLRHVWAKEGKAVKRKLRSVNRARALRDCKICSFTGELFPVDVARVIKVRTNKPVVFFMCSECRESFTDYWSTMPACPPGKRWAALNNWIREEALRKLLLDRSAP